MVRLCKWDRSEFPVADKVPFLLTLSFTCNDEEPYCLSYTKKTLVKKVKLLSNEIIHTPHTHKTIQYGSAPPLSIST